MTNTGSLLWTNRRGRAGYLARQLARRRHRLVALHHVFRATKIYGRGSWAELANCALAACNSLSMRGAGGVPKPSC